LPIPWLTALKATAAITWRSLVANLGITLVGAAVSLALGYKVGVSPEGFAGLSFHWTRPFGALVAIAQIGATVWAVKRAVEITLLRRGRKLDLRESLLATWSFAWRHFVAVFGVAAFLYPALRHIGQRALDHLDIGALVFLAVWTFGPSFIWAVRGMLRSQAKRLGFSK
jgi:hypothetical protein